MTEAEAYETLPSDAKWSCSFGYPGECGYNEYHRTLSGDRYVISNDKRFPGLSIRPSENSWGCRKIA